MVRLSGMNRKTGRPLGLALALALVCLIVPGGPARAALTATVDHTTVSATDLVTLTVRLSGSTSSSQPDLSALEENFQIIDRNTRSSSSLTIVKGRQTSQSNIDWIFTLRPKRQGILTIPSISVGNEQTEPITIKVVPRSADPDRGDRHVFFDNNVDTTNTWVQAQILYTVKLYYTEAISGDFPPAPAIDNAVIETVEKEKRYESIVNNRRYYVLEKRYAIFPQKSGTLTIPRETFVGYRGRGRLFSSRERVSAVSRKFTVEVKPRPASFPDDNWLPAKHLEISESWNRNPPEFVVGEPVNRTLTVTAEGVAASLIPPFQEAALDNAKTYKDPADTSTTANDNGIVSTRRVTVGIVPTRPGPLTLPEIRIPWWNTETETVEQAVIPASTFEVKPASTPRVRAPVADAQTGAPAAATGNADTIRQTWGLYLAVAFGILWLVSTLQWWITRRDLNRLRAATTAEGTPTLPAGAAEQDCFKALEHACQQGDPAAAHRALFLWAKTTAPNTDSLHDFAARASNEELIHAITDLERHLYARDTTPEPWNPDPLLTEIKALRPNRRTQKPHHHALTPNLNPS